jgi:hypothetical protein
MQRRAGLFAVGTATSICKPGSTFSELEAVTELPFAPIMLVATYLYKQRMPARMTGIPVFAPLSLSNQVLPTVANNDLQKSEQDGRESPISLQDQELRL